MKRPLQAATESKLQPAIARHLLAVARGARRQTYAPYSKFRVGAALLTAGGRIYRGCNIENASYGLTICAERVALGNALAAGERRLVALAVASQGAVTPCGACRQVLAEFAPKLEVLLLQPDGRKPARVFRLNELLPHSFVL